MGVPSSSPPPVGTVGVGELLADAQSKTLWLGVPPSISSAQAILISDLVGLQADLATNSTADRAYADTGLAGKANTTHIHAIADVTGLTAALAANAAALPSGCIVLWSGNLGTIPGGWALCDGSNGTPDLRDRFVIGAGGTTGTALSTGGSKNRVITSDAAGSNTPTGTVGSTTLDITMIPAHSHTVTDPGHNHAITDPGHIHTSASDIRLPSSGNNFNTQLAGGPSTISTGSATTGISVNTHSTGISIANAGGGASHTHTLTMNTILGHSHTVSFDVMPPYLILGYIMKV